MKNTNKNQTKKYSAMSPRPKLTISTGQYNVQPPVLLAEAHQPVLLASVIQVLDPKPSEAYLDLTAGYGGHADAIIKLTKQPDQVVLVDRDQQAIDALQRKYQNQKVQIIKNDFYQAALDLKQQDCQFDVILADLGVSSPHLDSASRGFSIKQAGPLDMRMDQSQKLTAEQIINHYPLRQLIQIIRDYGQEPKAAKIAQAIVANRPLNTTTDLAKIILGVAKQKAGKLHPATKTFQSVRIAVNDELNLLRQALEIWLELLKPGGRLAVISFHSLEDRIIKQAFKQVSDGEYLSQFQILTKKPMTADSNEQKFNPRSRSAKLRAVVKIKIKRG